MHDYHYQRSTAESPSPKTGVLLRRMRAMSILLALLHSHEFENSFARRSPNRTKEFGVNHPVEWTNLSISLSAPPPEDVTSRTERGPILLFVHHRHGLEASKLNDPTGSKFCLETSTSQNVQ